VGWFDTNASLKKLKNQVHFCPVTSDTAIYQARYASNVKALPTVRMQKPDGTVVYEAAGKNIPMTAAGLNGALAGAVNTAQGIRPVLPWRNGARGATRWDELRSRRAFGALRTCILAAMVGVMGFRIGRTGGLGAGTPELTPPTATRILRK